MRIIRFECSVAIIEDDGERKNILSNSFKLPINDFSINSMLDTSISLRRVAGLMYGDFTLECTGEENLWTRDHGKFYRIKSKQ